MTHVRDAVLVAVFACVLLGPVAHIAADALVPGYAAPRQSELEGAALANPAGLLGRSFPDGSFQDASEDLLSDWAPARDDLLLLNSGLQRQGIATAAAAFGYAVFPTFYGSECLEDAAAARQLEAPAFQPESTKRQRQLTRVLNNAAEHYPDVRFAVDFVLQPSQSSTNPAYALSGGDGLIDEEWVRETCVEPLDDRIEALVDTVDGASGKPGTFTTDHHWTLKRALESYNAIAEALGLSPANWNGEHAVVVSDDWYGNYTRKGLDPNYPSELVDQATDFSNLEFYTISGHERQPAERCGLREGYLASVAPGQIEHSRFESLYMDYYGEANSDIVNTGESNGKTCLLVGDSFSLCLKRYIASNYARTICILPGNQTVHKRLAKYISDYEVDDVIVIMHPEKSRFIASTSPKFMKTVK